MNVHVRLTGDVAKIVEQMIKRGRAASMTEAIRIALLDYNQRHLSREELLDYLAVKKMQQIDKETKEGKRRVLNAKEALGKYAYIVEKKKR